MAGRLSRRARRSSRATARKRTLSATLIVTLIAAMTMIVGVGTTGAATTTEVVGVNDVLPTGAWGSPPGSDTGSIAFEAGPGTPPAGTGSLKFDVTAAQHRAYYNYDYGLCDVYPACVSSQEPLAGIDELKYSTYRLPTSDGVVVPSLNIEIDPDPTVVPGVHYTTLVWEPSNNAGTAVNNTWQTWDALAGGSGKFWSTQLIPGFTTAGVSGDIVEWDDILAANPNAVIKYGIGPNIGTGPNFHGNVDKVVIGIGGNSTAFDFEPICSATCYVATAANGGNDLNTGQAGDPFLTIQKALNTVTPGGTVNVGAGTFDTTATTTIGVNVTLNGAGEGVTFLDGPAGPVGTINGLEITGTRNGVNIQNMTITDFDRGIFMNGNVVSNLHITNVSAINNRVHGIWLQANVGSGISGLQVTNVNASFNNSSGGQSGRGLWVINGPKTGVSITNSDFNNNGLVGLDVSDGSVDGLTLTGNTVTGNLDSGIGVVDAKNATVANNTVTNNGRFGIEIKNTAGNSAETGSGFVVVKNNIVTRTVPATDVRDYAGILAMRRLPAVPNIPPNPNPSGVVIKGNTVDGFKRKPSGSTGDGFGIVVGGTAHVITNNILTNNDVGVQIQAGNTPNVQSTIFFDRDDAPNGSAAVNRNSIDSTNGIRYRTAGAVGASNITCNWWGSDANPGYTGSAPWLTSSNLAGPCNGGQPPTITVGPNVLIKEGNSGNTPGSISVKLDHTYPGTVSVKYATATGGNAKNNGKATAGTDYVTATGTVSFPPNTLTAQIPLTLKGETALEQNETFLVNLSNPTNGMLTTSQSGIVTIGNDELPTVTVKGQPTVTEGAVSPFTVELDQTYWTSLNLSASTVSNTAASPGDFNAIVGQVVNFPGGTVGPKTVNVTTKLDSTQEPVESFYLQITGGSGVFSDQSKIKANKT